MTDAKITIEDAQAEIDGLLVARIIRDFQINFQGVYPEYIFARGVGPEQSMIGLAIKNGHLDNTLQNTIKMNKALEIISDLMGMMDWVGTGDSRSAMIDEQEFEKRVSELR